MRKQYAGYCPNNSKKAYADNPKKIVIDWKIAVKKVCEK